MGTRDSGGDAGPPGAIGYAPELDQRLLTIPQRQALLAGLVP